MDIKDSNFMKTLECPVCLDLFDEPKLLGCGHTICQKCVAKMSKVSVITRDSSRYPSIFVCGYPSICCPECNEKTDIPLNGGLKTNYRMVGTMEFADLVCQAQKSILDAHACSGCKKKTPMSDLFSCKTCEEDLGSRTVWICSLCAMREHKAHTTTECNKATSEHIKDALKGVADSSVRADMYIELGEQWLSQFGSQLQSISQLLRKRKRGFRQIEQRIKNGDAHLTQEDLVLALQQATVLKEKFSEASTVVKDAVTDLTSTMIQCQMALDELLPTATDEQRNNSEDDRDDELESESERGEDDIVDCLSLSEYNLKKPFSSDRT
ncbi:TAM-1 protein [Aphelenchoides avenae]|nr:TAM-1 protein [Aphelenchus avenae]